MLDAKEADSEHPFAILRGRQGWYDPVILEVFAAMRGNAQDKIQAWELSVREVTVGMVCGEDLKSAKGLLLIARSQEVTPALLERMRNFSPTLAIREPRPHDPAKFDKRPTGARWLAITTKRKRLFLMPEPRPQVYRFAANPAPASQYEHPRPAHLAKID